MKTLAFLTATLLTAGLGDVSHAVEPAAKCEARKNATAGKYWLCLQIAYAKAAKLGTAPDLDSCTETFDEKWSAAETKAGGACPTNGDVEEMQAFLALQAAAAAGALDGAGAPSCGDGEINAVGEHCDGDSLDGYSCTGLGLDGGSLACDASCDFDVSGCFVCTGDMYEGACWFLGGLGQSCDQACAAHGMVYDDATRTITGSDGSDAACEAVIELVSGPVTQVRDSSGCGVALGCLVDGTVEGHRCTAPATTSTAFFGPISRICACQ